MSRSAVRAMVLATGLLSAGSMLLAGCASGPVPLVYQAAAAAPASPAAPTVGVYRFVDARAEWPENSPSRTVAMVDAFLPIVFNDHADGPNVARFVTRAVRAELAASGLHVASGPQYEAPAAPGSRPALSQPAPDRVVLGRINECGWVQPGFAGLLFQSMMPSGKAYVDIDLWVLDARTGTVVWADTVREKKDSHDSWNKDPAEQGALLVSTLGAGLSRVMRNPQFQAVLRPAPPPPQGSDVVPDSGHNPT